MGPRCRSAAVATALALPLAAPAARAGIPTGPFAYATVLDVPYGPVAAVGDAASGSVSGHTLHECLPRPTPTQWQGPYPIVLFVHGGSWKSGSAEADL